VVGDYGSAGAAEQDVAALIQSWAPDFVLTTGDNNYPSGGADTIDANIGQYYHGFIYPYLGTYGQGATSNQFFPALGNHDWDTSNAQPYRDYFALPGNERYYEFAQGPVRLFAVDSDPREPDGITSTSAQASWLQTALAAAPEPWKLVYMHHPPYSSGQAHGSTVALQWPYQAWGASAVLAGHEHFYERIMRNGFPYITDGLGGRSLYGFATPLPGSEVRYNADYGALLCEASATALTFQFITRTGQVVETYMLTTGSSLVGQVLWQGRPAPPAAANALPISLTLRLATTLTQYPGQTTDAQGVFTVPLGVAATGVYTWWVKGPQFLATTGTLTFSGAPVTTVNFGLQRTGDANGDNLIDLSDFGLLRASFGRACGDPAYDGRADFTGDCLVDVADFALLRDNFGAVGAAPP
jgi:hypothetical protein